MSLQHFTISFRLMVFGMYVQIHIFQINRHFFVFQDKNEPLSVVDGSVDGCTNNSLDKPPFVPRNFFVVHPMNNYALVFKTSSAMHSMHSPYAHLHNRHFPGNIIYTICSVISKRKRAICDYHTRAFFFRRMIVFSFQCIENNSKKTPIRVVSLNISWFRSICCSLDGR